MAKVEDPSEVSAAITMMAEILKELKSKEPQGGDDRIGILAQSVQALVAAENSRPRENRFGPEISVFNPLGERDNPRPELKCKMFWLGHKLTKDVLTREEIEALNAMEPGHYRVTKSDNRKISFDVQAREDNGGKLEQLTFHFPCKNTEDRQNHNPMLSYLLEAQGKLTPSVHSLMQQVLELKAELAAKSNGA